MNINQEKLFSIVGKKLNKKYTKKELLEKHLESLWYNARPSLFHYVETKKEYNLITGENA